jgi:CBS domain-containing protein
MRIADVLRHKGAAVATVHPQASVAELLGGLAEHNVGAMVVVGDRGELAGIVSERDVVRRLYQDGTELLGRPVEQIMSTALVTCTPEDSVDHLSLLMTERRIRHVPVIVAGELAGIVSIGDVVKTRLHELEETQEQLQAYILQG